MILLTGASGFIGSHLLKKASGKFQFRCLVRSGSTGKIKAGNGIEIMAGDLLSEASIKKAMSGIHTVVHLAALIRTSKPEEVYKTNVEGTRLLVSEATKQGVSRFIFISSENALREDLSDAYASSKRQAEAIVRTFKPHLILRPCFVCGPGDDHGLGRLIELIEKTPVIPILGGLKTRIQPLYIDDMAEYLLQALERSLEGEYLLAGPDKISLNEFLRTACRIRGKKRAFLTLPYPFLKLAASICDRLPPSIGWGSDQLDNIYGSRTYPIDRTVNDFKIAPRSVPEGLADWFKTDKSLKESVSA